MASLLRFVPRIGGRVPVVGGDGPALLARLLGALLALGCAARMEGPDRLRLESGADGRTSPLSFVDGGTIWIAEEAGVPVLRYDLSTTGAFLLCAGLSPVAGGLAWFGTGDPFLTLFGLLAPPVWLYGANLVIARARVPGWFRRQCLLPTWALLASVLLPDAPRAEDPVITASSEVSLRAEGPVWPPSPGRMAAG